MDCDEAQPREVVEIPRQREREDFPQSSRAPPRRGYVAVQIASGLAARPDLDPVTISTTARAGFPRLLSEGIATFGLLGVVLGVGRTRAPITPFAVAPTSSPRTGSRSRPRSRTRR